MSARTSVTCRSASYLGPPMSPRVVLRHHRCAEVVSSRFPQAKAQVAVARPPQAAHCSPLAEVSLARLANAQNVATSQELSGLYFASVASQARNVFAPAKVQRMTSSAVQVQAQLQLKAPMKTLGHMPVAFQGGSDTGRKLRVLCYGDSLTVGWYLQGRQYEPYGRSLAEALGAALGGCEVSVCGHSGHTAEQMVANANKLAIEDVGGLLGKGICRSLDEAVHRPDLVIIMAGTNDIGRNADPQRVLEDLAKLHSFCHSRGVPTVAVAPPPAPKAPKGSAFEASRVRLQSLLANWVHITSAAAAFVNPAELIPSVAGGPCWDPDGLHLSPAGSKLLGQRLATALAPVLLKLARARGDLG